MSVAHLPLPPSVPGSLLFGNLNDLRNRPVDFVLESAALHGDIFRFHVLGKSFTIVSGEQADGLHLHLEKLPLDRSKIFEVWTTDTGMDIFEARGDDHRRKKRQLSMGVSRGVGLQFMPELVAAIDSVTSTWKPGSTVTMLDAIAGIAQKCILAAMTPADTDHLEEDLAYFGTNLLWVLSQLYPKWILLNPAHIAARGRVQSGLRAIVQQHADGAFADQPRASIVDAFLQAKARDGSTMGIDGAVGSCLLSLATGFGYLSRNASFALYQIVHNPWLLARAREEADALFADGVPKASDLRRLPHLQAAMYEAHRRYPMVPGVIYMPTEDVEILGHRVPRGDIFIVSPVPGHHDPDLFDNPYAFDVRHWLDRPRGCPSRKRFSPFGRGPRACPARGFMESLTLLILASMLRNLELELLTPLHVPRPVPNPLNGPHCRLPLRVVGPRTPSETIIPLPNASAALEHGIKAHKISIAANTKIVNTGEPSDAFFLLVRGEAVIERDGAEVERLAPGDSFGELGILRQAARTADVRSVSEVDVLRVEAEAFLESMQAEDRTPDELAEALWQTWITEQLRNALPGLSVALAQDLAAAAEYRTYQPKQVIVKQGAPPDAFYVILAGSCDVIDEEKGKFLGILRPGSPFGELGVFHQRPRLATVTANGEVRTLVVPGERLLQALGTSSEARAEAAMAVSTRLYEILEDMAKIQPGISLSDL